jgi:hypothetical protein
MTKRRLRGVRGRLLMWGEEEDRRMMDMDSLELRTQTTQGLTSLEQSQIHSVRKVKVHESNTTKPYTMLD